MPAAKSRRPGAWRPYAYPSIAEHHGSLRVVQVSTRSLSAANTSIA